MDQSSSEFHADGETLSANDWKTWINKQPEWISGKSHSFCMKLHRL